MAKKEETEQAKVGEVKVPETAKVPEVKKKDTKFTKEEIEKA